MSRRAVATASLAAALPFALVVAPSTAAIRFTDASSAETAEPPRELFVTIPRFQEPERAEA